MTRVDSKNLFDFKPTGQIDEDVQAMDSQFEAMMEDSPETMETMNRMQELQEKHDPESNAEYIKLFRGVSEPFVQWLNGNEALKFGGEETVMTSIKVPTSHCGEYDVSVEVYTPKELVNETRRGAYIYAHGGGAVSFSAADVRPGVQCQAVHMNMVTFNVDYRLAPEIKCPNNIKDYYEVVKYVSKNAESLGVDPAKIVLSGESGGGYIVLGTLVMLAEQGEGDLVKLAMPVVPMVDDYCFSDPLAMTVEERFSHAEQRKIYQYMIAADFEQQKTSPYLFPGKVSEELLEKFPPTIIIGAEFDGFITEYTRFSSRIRRAGRLLEFVVLPGCTHISFYIPGTKGNNTFIEVIKTIAREYVHC